MQCKMINLNTAKRTNRHEPKYARSFHQNKPYNQKLNGAVKTARSYLLDFGSSTKDAASFGYQQYFIILF